MFKTVKNLVWAFDAEWIPDPKAGRLLYDIPGDVPDAEVMQEMWRRGGATEENPTPYLKTVLCRVVSIVVVQRSLHKDGRVTLNLLPLPKGQAVSIHQETEANIVGTFLEAMGERQPQLVGYNSLGADLRILVQRAITMGLRCPRFAFRPNKPWEGVDYFARGGESHLDLKDYATPGWGSGSPSLHELAVLSGIPGKLDTQGDQVPLMWLEGKLEEIIAYNECDALTTYLVWLRMSHFAGHFSSEEYLLEQERVWQLLEQEAGNKPHLARFSAAWQQLAGDRHPARVR
ncbi:MAG: 3'-5' exonuclease [Magnetococcales bacterium]|nr:3'-5' exonuclease [Magnetococcales bacterium]MBF0114984.1 3'-5' exonuclease [Magnetococcales bacterium]